MGLGFEYSQTSGVLSHGGESIGTGYSGNSEGLNNSNLQMVHNLGPIPQGIWNIGIFFDDSHLGPCVAALQPTSQDVFGRGGFFIHGDNKSMSHSASDGCIILSKVLRQTIRDSGETEITVHV